MMKKLAFTMCLFAAGSVLHVSGADSGGKGFIPVLEAHDVAERALAEHDRGAAVMGARNRILRSIAEIDRYCDGNGVLHGSPAWAREGIVGDVDEKVSLSVNAAYAETLKNVGNLYGRPGYVSRGLWLAAEMRRRNGGKPVVFRRETEVPATVAAYRSILEAEKRELRNQIRPGGKDVPFWNVKSRFFMYPPSFSFKCFADAASYRFSVIGDEHTRHDFTADTPYASLAPVWEGLPEGFVSVICHAVSGDGRTLGIAGERRFWKTAAFDPAFCPPAPRSYREAARKALLHLLGWKEIATLEKSGRPDLSERSNFTSYPSKMQSAVIRTMISIAKEFPEHAERALGIARTAADYLLSKSERAGSPLEFFPPTYEGDGQLSGTYAGQIMLLYPAEVGTAFLALAEKTGDARYRDAAVRIADTYLKLQGKDGTWFLKMHVGNGKPVSPNRVVPVGIMNFLEKVHAVTGGSQYRDAADRAFAFIERGPLATWDWEGQFEDIRPAENRYDNLTKHNACSTAIYLLARFPGDEKRLAQARELLRFAEDQFVVWKAPCRPDGTGLGIPLYQYFGWKTPVALEQYRCYYPIGASVSKLICTYLAIWKAEGNPLDLAKARALGDAMVGIQDDSGRLRTYWIPEDGDDDPYAGAFLRPLGGDWFNCLWADSNALEMLSEVVGHGNEGP